MTALLLDPNKPLPRATVPLLVDGRVCRVTGTVVAQTIEGDPRIDIRLDRDPKVILQNVRLAEAEIETPEVVQ